MTIFTYMTQKYESLSFWEPVDAIDDRDALLLSLSVRFRVASTAPKCLILLELRSNCPSTLGMATLGVWPFRWLSFPVIPFTKFRMFSIFVSAKCKWHDQIKWANRIFIYTFMYCFLFCLSFHFWHIVKMVKR